MTEKVSPSWESIGERIRSRLTAKHLARERGLQTSREVIFNCANSIRAVHRAEYEKARELLEFIRSLLRKGNEALAPYPDLHYSGFMHDAEKEFAEAAATLALVLEESLPTPEALGVSDAAYLNGLGEAVGEMRRHLLDTLRQGEVARCERILAAMDDIYNLMVSMDYPDALTGGLKRTMDVVRGIMERTRGDLTNALRQSSLERKLKALEDKVAKGAGDDS